MVLTSLSEEVLVVGVVKTRGGDITVASPGWQEAQLTNADIETVPYTLASEQFPTKLPKDNQGGDAARIFVHPYGTATGPDADGDGIVDAEEEKLAQKFAPIILHDKDDNNLPTNVDWLLRRTSLEYYNNNGLFRRDDHISHGGPPLVQQQLLGKQGRFGGRIVLSDGTRSLRRQHTFAILDLPSEKDREGSLATQDWTTYLHAFRNYHGGVSLQFWRFYGFNTGDQAAHPPFEIDHHGGDWEGVEVVLDRSLSPVRFRLLGHTTISTLSVGEVQRDGLHLKVYSEPGGHASHAVFKVGETIRVLTFDVPIWVNDLTQADQTIRQETWTGGSVVWPSPGHRGHVGGERTASGGLVNVGEKTKPLNGQVFIQYSGLWGSLGDQFSGYWGPAYNETQMAADGFITAWCHGQKVSRSNLSTWRAECYPRESVD